MAIPPLVLRIIADSTGVKKGVAEAQASVGGLRGAIVKNATAIKLALGTAVVAGVAAAVNAASDLEESQNKANQVFRESVGIVNEFAENADQSFGLATGEALEMAGAFGAMFQSAEIAERKSAEMAVTMEKLAGDMASFNNVPVPEMLERLQAGLAGQAKPLRSFGVFLSAAKVEAEASALGFERLNGQFSDAAKVQARYNIVLRETKKQQGDFGRTLGTSLPNQMRVMRAQLINLAEKLGKVLLPVLLGVVKAFNALFTPIVKIVEIITTDTWDRFAEELKAAGAGAEEAATKVEKLRAGVEATNASLHGMGGIMAAQERATRRAAETAESWAQRQAAVAAQIDASKTSLANLTGRIRRFTNVTDADWKKWVGDTIDNFDAVETAFGNLADKAHVTANKIITEFNKQARQIHDYRQNLQDVASRNIPDDILQQLIDMGLGGAGIMEELATASDKKFGRIVRSMQNASRETRGLKGDFEDLKGSLSGESTFRATILVNGELASGAIIDHLNLEGLAYGGPAYGGRPYVVGENGPELFIPRTSGTVVPNHDLPMTGGGDTTIVVKVGEETLARVVEKGLNRAAARH